MMTEGIGGIAGSVTLPRGAPIPTAVYFGHAGGSMKRAKRYLLRRARSPHPKVEPVETVFPAKTYMLSAEDMKNYPRYESYGTRFSSFADLAKHGLA